MLPSSALSSAIGPRRFTVLVSLFGLALLAFIAVLGIEHWTLTAQLQHLTDSIEQAHGSAQEQAAAQVLQEVRKLISIPEDVQPAVATIVDAGKLKASNAFYAQAQNGDVLVITASRAILYRPSTHLILDVIPVQMQGSSAVGSAGRIGRSGS